MPALRVLRTPFTSVFVLLALGLAASATSACASDENTSSSIDGTEPGTPGAPGAGASSSGATSSGGPASPNGADGGVVGDPEPAAVPYTDFDVNHVLITGQSNSVSNSGTPVLSSGQPYSNLMFDTGVMPMTGCDGAGCKTFATPTSFVPLTEGDRFFGYAVETSAAGLANEVAMLGRDRYQGVIPKLPLDHRVLVSNHGRSGNTYWCLRKGGCNYKPGYLSPFEQGMMEVAEAQKIAEAASQSYAVRAVAAIHGESDHYSYTDGSQEFPQSGSDGTPDKIQSYADALVEWQADYEAGIKAITNQLVPVPLFVSQISGWNDAVTSKVAQFQVDAHVMAPGKVVLIGPSYHLPIDQQDCLHFTNHGARQLGEYFAKVYARVVFEGKPWEPVRPKTLTREGNVIRVAFHVPSPPLVLDTERVAETANFGFGFDDASGASPAITKVEVTGPDQVTITLASAPTGPTPRLTYAQNQVPRTCIGTPRGARGNLRDSDATPSKHGYDLHNWSVVFDVAVP
jgi:hypothetical protein